MNINTIAQLAGVSKSTVSRVLSKNGSVSKEAYEKVMKVIKETNYKPNVYAQMLNNMSSHLIGIITPDITNPYFSEIISCISEIAIKDGYRVILCSTDVDAKSELDYLNMLNDMKVEGVILICPTISGEEINYFKKLPIISIDSIIDNSIPYVCSDFYKGGYLALSKLVENGCKNILHVCGSIKYYANAERKRGFDVAKDKYFDRTIEFSELCELTYKSSYQEIKNYIELHANIDGIFADNDSFAFIVLRILNELNIPVPEKVKVIGYDNNFMIPMVYPLLSTIRQPIDEVAKTATTTLINLINNQQIKTANIIDVDYIKRSTTII